MANSDITVSGLTAIDDVAGIKLQWTVNDPWPKEMHYSLDAVEVWASATNNRASATKIGEGRTDFSHAGLSRGETRYYWCRARDKIVQGGPFYGEWYPVSPTAGVQGTELSGDVSIGTSGYWKIPNGLIFQWGVNAFGNGGGGLPTTVTFSTAFPNACIQVVASGQAGSVYDTTFACDTYTTTTFKGYAHDHTGASVIAGAAWIAIGY